MPTIISTERTKPTVTRTGFGDRHRAVWGTDPIAFAMFERVSGRIEMSDLFRGAQPAGSGGRMLADALRGASLPYPSVIRLTNILPSQKSVAQLADRTPVERTQLGRSLANAIAELGGVVSHWDHGIYRGKIWIEAGAKYPFFVAAPVSRG